MNTLSVVIPCYNEEESVEKVIESIPKGVYEIIVVDNNSTDQSATLAERAGARVIVEKTQGYGAALRTGFQNAQGEMIAAFDADNQYPAELLPQMLEFLRTNNLDFISASRFPLADKTSMNTLRQVGNWGLTQAANVLFWLRLRDSQSGMWLFKREILSEIFPEHHDMPFSQELKIRAARHPSIRFAEYLSPIGRAPAPQSCSYLNTASYFSLRLLSYDLKSDWVYLPIPPKRSPKW